ncbi:RNA polymerase sigma factor [Acinetobacter larvae]|uniref:RNA polymerase subunit sigma n=1 Tax=Acinetobacter larvae TaxID=1789224 RepID=A0A1B2LXS1_9GAMM|nr:RNA polymerase sigma factor [Acinetobacter larvae]AOA57744.1 hypothetical protein BFG52_04820 [Acinetobacter larvae]
MSSFSNLTINIQNKAKFNQFYLENYHWLYNWLCRKLSSAHQAEDILQDTFLKIFVSPETITQIKEPRPYLATTAKHLILNHWRRQKIEENYLKFLAEQQEELVADPEHVFILMQTIDRVASVLALLPKRQRLAMIMHYIKDIPQTQIAVHFNVCRKTIQRDLAEALVFCHIEMAKLH